MLSNLFVTYLPVPYNKRIGKSKVRLLRDALRSLQIIVTAIAQFNPLKLFLLLFLLSWGGTFILGILAWGLPLLRQDLWLIVVIGWNAGFIIMACAILALTIYPTLLRETAETLKVRK